MVMSIDVKYCRVIRKSLVFRFSRVVILDGLFVDFFCGFLFLSLNLIVMDRYILVLVYLIYVNKVGVISSINIL